MLRPYLTVVEGEADGDEPLQGQGDHGVDAAGQGHLEVGQRVGGDTGEHL